jgi:peptidoglycan/xylan/chitin deacetylase (PgdA/CDA1 family)
MKQAVLHALRVSGAFAPFRLANRLKTLILTYHRFSADERAGATSARAFAEQLAYLRARYAIVPLSAVQRHLCDGHPLPPRAAVITVDDGYRDFYEVAFPILRRFEAPATLFAVSAFVDGATWIWTDKLRFVLAGTRARELSVVIGASVINARLDAPASRRAVAGRINEALKRESDDARERIIMRIAAQLGATIPMSPPSEYGAVTWNELRAMTAAGIEIGSHTVSHPILTRIDHTRLTRELTASRERLETMLDRPATLFCYPNGDYDRAIRDEVARAGYRLAVTTEPGLNDASSDPLALKRIHTEPDLTHFVQSTSGFEQIKNRLRPQRHASAAPAPAPAHRPV